MNLRRRRIPRQLPGSPIARGLPPLSRRQPARNYEGTRAGRTDISCEGSWEGSCGESCEEVVEEVVKEVVEKVVKNIVKKNVKEVERTE
jgi:hypothetical protein